MLIFILGFQNYPVIINYVKHNTECSVYSNYFTSWGVTELKMIQIAMVKVQAHMTKFYGYDRNDDGIMLNKRIYDRIVGVSLYYDRIVGVSIL